MKWATKKIWGKVKKKLESKESQVLAGDPLKTGTTYKKHKVLLFSPHT